MTVAESRCAHARRAPMAVLLIGSLCLLGGCAALQEQRDLSRQLRADQLKFYQHLANSYYVLGFEYYALARELENTRQPAQSQQLARRAKMYHDLSADLHASAEILARRYELDVETAGTVEGADSAEPSRISPAAEQPTP